MERIKRFFRDESAAVDPAAQVIMIAAVGILLAAALIVYYDAITTFFTETKTAMQGLGSNFGQTAPFTGGS